MDDYRSLRKKELNRRRVERCRFRKFRHEQLNYRDGDARNEEPDADARHGDARNDQPDDDARNGQHNGEDDGDASTVEDDGSSSAGESVFVCW